MPTLTRLLALGLLASTTFGCGEDPSSADGGLPDANDPVGLDASRDGGPSQDAEARDSAGVDGGPIDLGPCPQALSSNPGAACGVSAFNPCAECRDLTDCGDGAGNLVTIPGCDNCLRRAATHFCDLGRCRRIGPLAQIEYRFAVPPLATNAPAYTVATLDPVTADGVRLRCDEILSSCPVLELETLNTANSNWQSFPGGANPQLAYVGRTSAEEGDDVLLLVLVTSKTQGKGEILARGCVEGLAPRMGETLSVSIDRVE